MDNRKQNPKVSIVVPIYNVSAYIERCLSSIINQTYGNIECILVDDVTPDDSIEKCEKILEAYQGPIDFKITHHSKNRGLSAARNTGTEIASGDYIYYLDSDDEIPEGSIQLLVNEVYKHPDVEIVQGKIDTEPLVSWYNPSFLDTIDYVTGNINLRKMYFKDGEQLPSNAWNKLIKRDFILDNSLFFEEGLIFEDILWMYFVVTKLNSYAVAHYSTYIHYTVVGGSIMSVKNAQRLAQHGATIISKVLEAASQPCYKEQLLCYFKSLVYYNDGKTRKDDYYSLIQQFGKRFRSERMYLMYLIAILYRINAKYLNLRGWRLIISFTVKSLMKKI